MDCHSGVVANSFHAPDLFVQLFLAEDDFFVEHEEKKHLVFLVLQLYLTFPDVDASCLRVDFYRTGRNFGTILTFARESAVLSEMGFDAGECRLPLGTLSEANRERVKLEMEKFGLPKLKGGN